MDLNRLMDLPDATSVDELLPTDNYLTDGRHKDTTRGGRSHKKSANKVDRSNIYATAYETHQRAIGPASSHPEPPPLNFTREGSYDSETTRFKLQSRDMSREPSNFIAASSAGPFSQVTSPAEQHNRRSKKARAQRSGMKKARSGPLVPIGKLKAHLMRKLHVCEACRRKKVSCDARRKCLYPTDAP